MESADDLTTLANGVETTAGMVLGTVGYMSPEQVRGETVGNCSDILFAPFTAALPPILRDFYRY